MQSKIGPNYYIYIYIYILFFPKMDCQLNKWHFPKPAQKWTRPHSNSRVPLEIPVDHKRKCVKDQIKPTLYMGRRTKNAGIIPSCLTLSVMSHEQMRESSTVALSFIVLGANSILLLQRMVKPACYKDISELQVPESLRSIQGKYCCMFTLFLILSPPPQIHYCPLQKATLI